MGPSKETCTTGPLPRLDPCPTSHPGPRGWAGQKERHRRGLVLGLARRDRRSGHECGSKGGLEVLGVTGSHPSDVGFRGDS